ncbi:2-phosphosulfolactate phosphatase [Rhodococcus sp. G-MC3]|uniref:2-phosphosulfolactate phosphatase n=1 Tax=Rhodococcus sp. G-MC3 TaxID=3046209 RepID=UPI0024BA73E5|nr:2-phosphosulfolactate phosphatase [Rhodococcus sp. G-MC3]MDJ0391837.1 2-phosphosulfolactate phosphatase [Rhodococcus sp. G-MC3]
MTSSSPHHQLPYSIRFDWGLSGAEAIAMGSDVAVVVDVLSFTTTLSVALDVGATVVPWTVRDDSAATYARRHDADLAVRRSEAVAGDVSLSPATLRIGRPPTRLVLPSPNGSTISAYLASGTSVCVGASLRNAPAVASWIKENRPPTDVVSVVAAGERWPDDGLRPSIEDLWGAGFVIAELDRLCSGRTLSPEARMARDAWTAVRTRVPAELAESASGRELIDTGYRVDVDIAGEVNSSSTVPVLESGEFTDAAAVPGV